MEQLLLSGRSRLFTRTLLFARFRGLRGGSASKIQTWARTELLFARFWSPAPSSQTPAAECFRSKAELLFARSRRRPFLVSHVLQLTVPLDRGRVLLPVSSPIIRMAGSPFLRTIAADLLIFRVRGNLLVVIIGAPTALAVGFAAHELPRLIFRGLEGSFTVATSPFDHTGGCRT